MKTFWVAIQWAVVGLQLAAYALCFVFLGYIYFQAQEQAAKHQEWLQEQTIKHQEWLIEFDKKLAEFDKTSEEIDKVGREIDEILERMNKRSIEIQKQIDRMERR